MKHHVIKEVNRIFNCDIFAKDRKMINVYGRIAFSVYMRKYSKLTLQEIGNILNKPHNLVFRYVSMHEGLIQNNEDYEEMYSELLKVHPMNICNENEFSIERLKSNEYQNVFKNRSRPLLKEEKTKSKFRTKILIKK